MPRTSWFSEDGDDLLFDTYLSRMESWQTAISDEIITARELEEQSRPVAELLRQLESQVDEQMHEQLTTEFMEWAVLQGMQAALIMQEQTGAASA